jgi:hypothetical protein
VEARPGGVREELRSGRACDSAVVEVGPCEALWLGRTVRRGLGSGPVDGGAVGSGPYGGGCSWVRALRRGLFVGPALRRDCGGAVPGCVIVLVAVACVKGAFGVAGAIFDP